MVEPETFAFLADLATNNRKAWLDAHRSDFDDARRNFTGIAMTLHAYADRFDASVADAKSKPKQSYSKIYQDPRGRIGRSLYRTDVDVFANAGHPEEGFGYFLHVEPGNCYAGAGLFQPSKTALARLRERMMEDPQELQVILADPEFKTEFSEGLLTRRELDELPDGVLSSNTAAPYLKMVGLGCRKDIPDVLLLDDDVIDLLIEIFRAARPLVCYFD